MQLIKIKLRLNHSMKINQFVLTFFTAITIIGIGCKDDDPKPYKQNITLQIDHLWNDSALVLNKTYYWKHDFKTDTITPTTLTYHINNLKLTTEDKLEIPANKQYYMVDYEEKKVLNENITFTTPNEGVKYYVNALEFTIGVADSAVNADNLLGNIFVAPMYWGMIQGYINFKFEALSPKVNALIYHIGGYSLPYINSRKVKIQFDKSYLLNQDNVLTISANLFKLFDSINTLDIERVNLIHSPSADSKLIADNISQLFMFKSMK